MIRCCPLALTQCKKWICPKSGGHIPYGAHNEKILPKTSLDNGQRIRPRIEAAGNKTDARFKGAIDNLIVKETN